MDGFFRQNVGGRQKKNLKNLDEAFSSVVVEGTPSIEQPVPPFPFVGIAWNVPNVLTVPEISKGILFNVISRRKIQFDVRQGSALFDLDDLQGFNKAEEKSEWKFSLTTGGDFASWFSSRFVNVKWWVKKRMRQK